MLAALVQLSHHPACLADRISGGIWEEPEEEQLLTNPHLSTFLH